MLANISLTNLLFGKRMSIKVFQILNWFREYWYFLTAQPDSIWCALKGAIVNPDISEHYWDYNLCRVSNAWPTKTNFLDDNEQKHDEYSTTFEKFPIEDDWDLARRGEFIDAF